MILSFEQGWWHPSEGHIVNGWHFLESGDAPIPEIQNPNGWDFRYADQDMPDNPYFDGETWSELIRPECVHRSQNELPAEEWDKYILDGDWTYKLFCKNAWSAGLRAVFGLDAGRWKMTVRTVPDMVKEYRDGKKVYSTDPEAANIRILHNMEVGPWIHLVSGELNETEFVFDTDGSVQLGFDFLAPYALKSNAMFVDYITLEKVDEPEPHRGAPREQYERTYVLLPQQYKAIWARAVVNATWNVHRYTVGAAADDAGIGDLDNRNILIVNPHMWENSITDFFEEHYPGVEYVIIEAADPADLEAKLRALDEEPPPPPPPPPPVEDLPGELITFHFQDRHPESLALQTVEQDTGRLKALLRLIGLGIKQPVAPEYDIEMFAQALGFTSTALPYWVKTFVAEQAKEFRAAGAKKVLQRYHRDGQYDLYAADKYKCAKDLVATYADSAYANIEWIAAIEGTNEEPNSNNREKNKHVADLEWNLARVHAEMGLPPLVSPCIAIGNVELSDLDIFVPLAKVIYGWAYHAYWPVYRNGELPLSEWKWFDERWMWHYEYLRAHNPDLKVLLTECGPCQFNPRPDGGFGGFDPTAGWRSDDVYTGTILEKRIKYFDSIQRRRSRWLAWNDENSNALESVMLYTVNQVYMGWKNFRHYPEDQVALGNFLAGLQAG